MKIIPIFAVFTIFSLTSQAQTIKERLDQRAKDPVTRENAAKADVYIIKNKQVSDNPGKKVKSNSCIYKKVRKPERLED